MNSVDSSPIPPKHLTRLKTGLSLRDTRNQLDVLAARLEVRQVMGPAAAQIGAGGVVGVVVAALALSLAGTVLAVSPRDPLTYTVCTVTLVSLALLALNLPARRAANAEPMRALRRD